MNSNHPMVRLGLVPILLVAGAAWSLSWAFNAQTDGGSLRALGLDQDQWRAVLNPALLAVLAELVAWAARDARPARLVLVAGAGSVLAGNLLAHGLLGRPTPAADVGSLLFVAGAVAMVVAFGWLIGQGGSRLTGRRFVGVGGGVATSVGVATMVVAAPAAASLALVLLIDALRNGAAPRALEAASQPSPGVGAAALSRAA